VPFLGPVRGPEQFYFYNLFRGARTGAPLSFRNRARGSVDAYAAAVGRWLVTRDGFDFLLFYLSDYDYASHLEGPDAADAVLRRSDEAVGGLVEAGGGIDQFLERYAVLVIADHGQTRVRQIARAEEPLRHEPDTLVAASNRAAHVYRTAEAAPSPRRLAERFDGEPSAGVVLFRDEGAFVARRDGADLVLHATTRGVQLQGDPAVLDQPDAVARVLAALRCPNAGDVVVSAAAGWEYADLGGRHHLGGGSHGSLDEGDSLVPVLSVGLGDDTPARIVDVAPRVLAHFGVEAPLYTLRRAA
jgi:hypothetical protein